MARLNVNLLVNPDAEGSAGATDFETVAAPSGWTTTASFSAVTYAAGGSEDLNTEDSTIINGGNNYFAGGPNDALATAVQRINFGNLASQVDSDSLQASLSGFLGGYFFQNDNMVVTATFYNSSRTALSSFSIGPILRADRADISQLLFRNALLDVPVGARSVDVVLTATRNEGIYNDGYADNLNFKFTAKGTPISGTSFNDTLQGTALSDRINGAEGNDVISGLGNDDFLLGGIGADRLTGGVGNDILEGGAGNDRLTGNAGRDVFVLRRGEGRETITDFQNGQDFIALGSGLTYSDLNIVQITNAAQIKISSTGTVVATLLNVSADQISVADFTIS